MINDLHYFSCSIRVTEDVATGDLNETTGLYSGMIGQVQRKVTIVAIENLCKVSKFFIIRKLSLQFIVFVLTH